MGLRFNAAYSEEDCALSPEIIQSKKVPEDLSTQSLVKKKKKGLILPLWIESESPTLCFAIIRSSQLHFAPRRAINPQHHVSIWTQANMDAFPWASALLGKDALHGCSITELSWVPHQYLHCDVPLSLVSLLALLCYGAGSQGISALLFLFTLCLLYFVVHPRTFVLHPF